MRKAPKNLQNEPAYPIDGMVIFSLASPDMTGHFKHKECEIEEPHHVAKCGLWKDPLTILQNSVDCSYE